MNVREFLRERGVGYEVLHHRPTYDAQRLAEAVATTGHHVAKTVLLKSDMDYVLAVVPATHTVDLAEVKNLLKADAIRLASEKEIAERFPDCQVGAVPPFGSEYGVSTLMDEALSHSEEIVFESNRHDEAIRMSMADYLELAHPAVTHISYSEGE